MSSVPAGPDSAIARVARAPRSAGVAGLLFAVLFVVSLVAIRAHPPAGASAAEIADWYVDSQRTAVLLVGIYLVPFAGIAFLWFTAVLRHNLAELTDRFYDTVLFGSALLFIAMLFAAAAAGGGALAATKLLDAPAPGADAVTVTRGLGHTLFYVYGLRAAAVFMMVSSTVGLRRGGLPRWLGVAGIAGATALLLGVSQLRWLALLFPAWVATVSALILAGRAAGTERMLPADRRTRERPTARE